MTRLHVFDMDGTLLQGSACVHLSEHAGVLAEITEIENAWGRGEVGHVEFYDLCLPLWTSLDAAGIEAVFTRAPWIGNIPKVLADITRRGEYSAVITLSPTFFAQKLQRWGFTTTHGAGVQPGVIADPAKVLTPAAKVTIARTLLTQYHLTDQECVCYGDSASDVPLFRVMPHTVAINAPPGVLDIASARYTGHDLWDAYQLGRSLINSSVEAS